jgi:divalent metal cation (Fe/Co/Zn/Cd) transporter
MVGKRELHRATPGNKHNGRPLSRGEDLEDGRAEPLSSKNGDARPRPRVWRFRDAASAVVGDQRREELKKALLTQVDLNQLEQYRKSEDELKEIKDKKVRKYYKNLNARLNDILEVDAVVMAVADDAIDSMDPDPDHDGIAERRGGIQDVSGHLEELLPDEERERRQNAAKKARWAININVVANIALLIGKIVAAFSSPSLSLMASLVDSALDLLCTIIVWTTNRLVAWRLSTLRKKFPVGRRRLEPLGILVFSIIMVISFLSILQESVEKLMPLKGKAESLPPIAICALGATILIKGVIWFGCMPIKTTQVQALAQDCKTDVIFNTLSLLFPLVGSAAGVWWLDPAGAGLLSLFIIYDWGETCFENVTRLSGQAAEDDLLRKLHYLAWRFSSVVEGFKSIKVWSYSSFVPLA